LVVIKVEETSMLSAISLETTLIEILEMACNWCIAIRREREQP